MASVPALGSGTGSLYVSAPGHHEYSLSASSSGIAIEHVERVKQCLLSWFPGEIVTITPFHRGHNSVSCYLLESEGEHYVLRLLPLEVSDETIAKQLYMITESEKLGLSPKVMAVKDRAVLMEYMHEPTLTPEVARQHAEVIGASLYQIHSIPRNPHVDSTRYLDGAEARYRLIRERPGFPDTLEAIQLIRTGSQQLSALRVNIHGDLHPHNGFWTSQGLRLIDWERTLWEHPYLDLARFAMSWALDAESEEQLLIGYFDGAPTEEEREQYQLAKRLNWANMAIMCLKIAAVMLDQDPLLSINPDHPIDPWASYMNLSQ